MTLDIKFSASFRALAALRERGDVSIKIRDERSDLCRNCDRVWCKIVFYLFWVGTRCVKTLETIQIRDFVSDGRRSIRGGGRRRLAGNGGRGCERGSRRVSSEGGFPGAAGGSHLWRRRRRPASRTTVAHVEKVDTDARRTNDTDAHRHTTVPFRVLHNGHERVSCGSRKRCFKKHLRIERFVGLFSVFTMVCIV